MEGPAHKLCVNVKTRRGVTNTHIKSKELIYLKLKLFLDTEKKFLLVNVGIQ
jgi:hypothetical protein